MPAKNKDKQEKAKLFLKDLLSKIPEDKRPTVEEVLSGEDVLDVLGDGVSRQADYSRAMDKAREENEKARRHYEDNVAWRAEQKTAFDNMTEQTKKLTAENARFRQALRDPDALLGDDLDPDPSARPPIDTKKFISREEAELIWNKRADELERGGLSIMSSLSKLTARHLKDYDEVLDADALIKHATEKHLDINAAYTDFTSERAAAAAEANHKKELEDLSAKVRQDTLDEVRRNSPNLPHVVGNNEPSIAVQLKADKKDFGARAAVDEFYRMQKTPSSS